MEPPSLPAATVPPPPGSSDSSPRSRNTDGLDDLPAPIAAAGTSSLRLMCSYGGHIVPRPHDRSLCYVGGDTRIISVARTTTLSALIARLSTALLNGRSFTLKYQLPSEDLDSLISVTTDEDLENLIDEYDRTVNSSSSNSVKSSRLRLFLFPLKPDSTQSMGQILETSAKSDDWFLSALNSAGLLNRGFSDSASVNSLLGLDDIANGVNLDPDGDDSLKNAKQQKQLPPQQVGQDVHSVPESPKLDTSSSFESTSSPPSLANLPPIRVHVEDARVVRPVMDQNLGIEDQFAQITLGGVQRQQQQEEGFGAISTLPPPSTVAVPGVPITSAVVSGEYLVYSEDDRSDHAVPAGHRKPPDPQPQPPNLPPSQAQQKSGGHELMSPDSVSSENSSVNNPLSRPKPVVYQEPVYHIPSGMNIISNNPGDQKTSPSDPGTRVQVQDSGYKQLNTQQQQLQQQQQFIYDSGYVLQRQFEQQNIQHQQQPQQQHQQQQQQYIHAAQHYINHHPNGAVQIPGYIPVYPSSQQHPLQQPYPVYYIPSPGLARETQAYNFPIQQSGNMSEAPETPGSIPPTRLQTQPNPSMSVPQPNAASVYNPIRQATKPEMDSGGVSRTTVMGGPQHQHQVQQQFVGYSQVHHPAQFVVPSGIPGGDANLGYQYSDMARAQIYYGQPPATAQYKTMLLPDGTTVQLPSEPVKQQIRNS